MKITDLRYAIRLRNRLVELGVSSDDLWLEVKVWEYYSERTARAMGDVQICYDGTGRTYTLAAAERWIARLERGEQEPET